MLKTRVIPTLLLKKGGFYKGIRFKNHKYVGDPINTIKIFNEKEVDEIAILDINATPTNSKPDFKLLEQIAGEAFMPMAYGGGIRNAEDIQCIFEIGYEKVIINTAAFENPSLVSEAAKIHGSQSIVLSIDVKRDFWGRTKVVTHCGTNVIRDADVIMIAKQFVEIGVGEIIITTVDKDGTLSGYDLELIKNVAEAVTVPVIASGGAGSLNDLLSAKVLGVSGVAVGAMFVYQGPHRAVLISYPNYTDLEILFNNKNE